MYELYWTLLSNWSCQKKAMSNRAHTQAFFHAQFLEGKHNGLVSDCDIVIIDKTNPAEPTIREM